MFLFYIIRIEERKKLFCKNYCPYTLLTLYSVFKDILKIHFDIFKAKTNIKKFFTSFFLIYLNLKNYFVLTFDYCSNRFSKKIIFLKDSFIVDNGKAGIWVWIGKKSSQKERQEAMRNALVCLKKILITWSCHYHIILKGILTSERIWRESTKSY